MKKIILSVICVLCFSNFCHANSLTINILGIDISNIKNRNIGVMLTGAIMSHVTHELGHLAYAQFNGGGSWNLSENVVVMNRYYDRDHESQQMFHRAGFLAQLMAGGILTLCKTTRHADFTVGFNAYTSINALQYTVTGGSDQRNSDINQLDNGVVEGSIYVVGAGYLLHQNLLPNIGN